MDAGNLEEKLTSTARQFNHLTKKLSESLGIVDNHGDGSDHQAFSQFDIPGDSNCLFWAVTLAYLIPVKDDDTSFEKRYKDLFGNDETVITKLDHVKSVFRNYNPLSHSFPTDYVLENLVRPAFRNRVIDFMESNFDKFEYFSEVTEEQYGSKVRNLDTWSGDPEIQAISLMLNCRINVDERIFPVVARNEEISPNFGKTTLRLFHINRSTGDAQIANHYNYGLENWFLLNFRERLIDNTFELLEMYSSEQSKMILQERDAHNDYNDPENNCLHQSEESAVEIEMDHVEDIANVVDSKVLYRINNEVKYEASSVDELSQLLEEYQEDCKQANEPVSESSIEKGFCSFQNPKHVAQIFSSLRNIPEKNELLKYAFIVLKIVIDELCKRRNYDLVNLIANVKEVDIAKNDSLQNDVSDLDVLQFQRVVARTKNKESFHEAALEILSSIMGRIKHEECSNTSNNRRIENIESSKFYFSLLISRDIAMTKHLMGKYEESRDEYKALHDKIMKDFGIPSDTKSLLYKMYKEISQSEKYKSILSLDRGYLSILHIRDSIAHQLVSLGNEKRNNLKHKKLKYCDDTFNKAVEYYQDAFNLYKNNYEIRRIDAEFRRHIEKNMLNISHVYSLLGELKALNFNGDRNRRLEMLSEALNYYNKAFEMHSASLTRPEQLTAHPVNSKFITDITWILYNIAWIHMKIGTLTFYYMDSAAADFEKALNIFEKLYMFEEKYFGREHKNTLNKLSYVAFINTKLGYLKSRDNPQEATRHHEKACVINEEILAIKRLLGDEDQDTFRIRSYLNKRKY